MELFTEPVVPIYKWNELFEDLAKESNIIIGPRIIGGAIEGGTIDSSVDLDRSCTLILYSSGTNVAIGDGTYGIIIPDLVDGYNLLEATASVYTKGVTGSMTIQIRRSRAGSDVDMLNTKITLEDVYTATSTDTNLSNDDIITGDLIFVDVDTIHTTAAKGLSVVLTFTKT